MQRPKRSLPFRLEWYARRQRRFYDTCARIMSYEYHTTRTVNEFKRHGATSDAAVQCKVIDYNAGDRWTR